MGEYTELCVNVGLKKDMPDEAMLMLKALCSCSTDTGYIDIPDHPFFKTERWHRCLHGVSAYFDGVIVSEFTLGNSHKYNQLSVRSDIKNYTSEFELFLNWLSQYLVPDTLFVGYLRRGGYDYPRLLYFDGHNVVAYSVELNSNPQIMDGEV